MQIKLEITKDKLGRIICGAVALLVIIGLVALGCIGQVNGVPILVWGVLFISAAACIVTIGWLIIWELGGWLWERVRRV